MRTCLSSSHTSKQYNINAKKIKKIIGNKNDKIAYIGGRISCDLKEKKKINTIK